MPPKSSWDRALDELRAAGEVGVEALDAAVVERAARCTSSPRSGRAAAARAASRAARRPGRAPGSSRRARRAPRRRRRTASAPRQAPTGCCGGSPRSSPCGRCRGSRTSRSTASRGAPRRSASSKEARIETPSSGFCWTPLTNVGSGSPAASRIVARHVDDVGELGADLALRLDAGGPVHDGAVARAAPVRGDLLGPLVGRVHRVRPADRVVVVGRRRAELVDVGRP